jgi:hypothetical protein
MFSQHYAESRGVPSCRAWKRVTEVYGPAKSRGILAAVRIIMMGNAYGVPIGSLLNRFRGRPDPRCSMIHELSILAVIPFFIIFAPLNALTAGLLRLPIIRCRN